MKIKAFELYGKNCITIETGTDLFNRIFQGINAGREVELDFTGVNIFASPFFNSSIGRLFKDFDKITIQNVLKIINLNLIGNDILKLVIENSIQYYNNENYQKDLDEILNSQEEELD